MGGRPATMVTLVTAGGSTGGYLGRGGMRRMSRFRSMVRSARRSASAAAVFALCIGASMALPVTLALVGFQSV